jgi:hypothetical protein
MGDGEGSARRKEISECDEDLDGVFPEEPDVAGEDLVERAEFGGNM